MQTTVSHDVDQLLFSKFTPTPSTWLSHAENHLGELLNDHAACEKKAAQFVLTLSYHLYAYPHALKTAIRIAREELRHFEQVHMWMGRKSITMRTLSASRYASRLHACNPTGTPDLFHKLLVAAVIEARSCERFEKLVPVLHYRHADLAAFYQKLWLAEKRHAMVYIDWCALLFPEQNIESHLQRLLQADALAVSDHDQHFRFHSGPPSRMHLMNAD